MANYVLEILDGDRAGDVLSLTDRPLRIGRKPSNDLVLADEKTSGVHAEVVLEGDRHVLRDLGSTNGTFLDGKRVTELVLTAGDIVTVGRLRVKFRLEGEEATGGGGADAGDMAVHRLDAGRLQKRGGSVGVLAALVVLGLGAGGYLWWQGQQEGDAAAAGGPKRREAIELSGNKLAQGLATCEAEAGWNLRFAGSGFQPTSRAHTGTGAFEAVRAEAADAADFAIATLSEPLTVLSGRSLSIQAFTRTEGDGYVALRAVFFAAGDSPFRFRTGVPLQQHADWSAVESVLAVPPGCDRLQLELVAVLGSANASVVVDDVAVIESGQAAAIDQKLEESSQTAIGTGAALAVRSTDPDNPATLLSVLPGTVRAAFVGLHRAGFGCLSDVGATLACQATESKRSFALAANGADGLEFVFPAEAAGSLLVQANAEAGFQSTAAESQFQARSLVLGSRMTRTMLQFEVPVACTGKLGNGLYRLHLATAAAELVLGFRAERKQASDLLSQAQAALQQGKPGAALDLLRDLVGKVPQDSEMLGQAQQLRTQLLTVQADTVKQLQTDLGEAEFFDTRGGFQRVVLGVEDLFTLYGEKNLDDLAAVQALRQQAQARLAAIDGAQQGSQRQSLEALAKALGDAQQTGLAGVVQDYVKRHLGGK